MTGAPTERQRIDKWLFFARVAKSRTLAGKFVASGHVRLNSDKISLPSQMVKIGDVLTITMERRILVLRIVDGGTRRGPATEAQTLYADLSPPAPPKAEAPVVVAEREPGSGRPTKRNRREMDKFRMDPGDD